MQEQAARVAFRGDLLQAFSIVPAKIGVASKVAAHVINIGFIFASIADFSVVGIYLPYMPPLWQGGSST
jgi:hypothetical protein